MFVPVHLSVYYPYKVEIPGHTIALAGVLLALTTMLACQFARRWPYLAIGWLRYLGTLVPVIGLVQVGDQALGRSLHVPSVDRVVHRDRLGRG